MADSGTHWFDRLAQRRTRREALKLALAGTAALSLPALRPAPARAADAKACRRGCNWTAHNDYLTTLLGCQPSDGRFLGNYLGYFVLGFGIPGAIVAATKKEQQAVIQCQEMALLQQKADYYDCLSPLCGGFDPTRKGGPCDFCSATCCVDPTVVYGYTCCALGCACGSDTGACHGGGTPC